jgi:hypothetical protein
MAIDEMCADFHATMPNRHLKPTQAVLNVELHTPGINNYLTFSENIQGMSIGPASCMKASRNA